MDCTIAGPTSIMLSGCIVSHFRLIYTNTIHSSAARVIHNTGMVTNQSTAIESFITQKGFLKIILELTEYYLTSAINKSQFIYPKYSCRGLTKMCSS